VPVDLRVRYPVLLTADAWHLRTKGRWERDTGEAYRECRLVKERKFADEKERVSQDDWDMPEELLDEAWILPNELLPEALLVEGIVAEEEMPEEGKVSHQHAGPIHVD
jgi:hypothetical protein